VSLRLSVHLPPLRERAEDIPVLVEHFLGKHGGDSYLVETDVVHLFERYPWSGNIRELENSIHRLVTFSPGNAITMAEAKRYLPEVVEAVEGLTDSERRSLREECKMLNAAYEKQRVLEALEHNNWNQTRAARELGISQPAMSKKMKKHGLRKPT
jgi:transcriptional regulator with PAS, ATPase and Fis domain